MAEPLLDDFQCRLCGECCRSGQRVTLNRLDLQRLAKHLNLSTPEDLQESGYVVLEPGEHGVPRFHIRFKTSPVGDFCPFLVNDLDEFGRLWGRCSLHGTSAKPLVCRLAPLAREIDLDTQKEQWRIIPPVIGCPGWGDRKIPTEGVLIEDPSLPQELRGELDRETEEFHLLRETLEDTTKT